MKTFFKILAFLFIVIGSAMLAFKPYKYDFSAENDANKTVNLKSFDGKYKVIYFGYLYCPDVCPTTLFLAGEAIKSLKRDDFELIFITLDPQRDTPENLTLMAQNFYPNATGLRLKNLEKTASNYGVKFQKISLTDSAIGYSVAHSSALYLFDKEGKFFTEVSNLTSENILKNLQNLLAQRP